MNKCSTTESPTQVNSNITSTPFLWTYMLLWCEPWSQHFTHVFNLEVTAIYNCERHSIKTKIYGTDRNTLNGQNIKQNQNQEMAKKINIRGYKKRQRKINETQNRKLEVSIRKTDNVEYQYNYTNNINNMMNLLSQNVHVWQKSSNFCKTYHC
jgi:hypothetical protein